MNKRLQLRLKNLRLYLKKNVFNSKYIVRNTSAVVLGASFIGMVICGSKMITMSKQQEAVMAATGDKVGVASSSDLVADGDESIVIEDMAMLNPDSVSKIMATMDTNVEMAVEANDFQIVAQVQDEQAINVSGVSFTVSEPVVESVVSTEGQSSGSMTVTQTTTSSNSSTSASTATEASQPSAPQQISSTSRAPIALTDEEVREMACVLTLECGNQCYEGQLAVANLILNRLETGWWGNTIHGVLYAQNQFSVVNTTAYANCMANGPQASCVQAVLDAASGNNNIGSYLSYRALWSVNPANYTDYTIIQDHLFF